MVSYLAALPAIAAALSALMAGARVDAAPALVFLATSGLFGFSGGSEWGMSHYRIRAV
jgi:hypothetical protein